MAITNLIPKKSEKIVSPEVAATLVELVEETQPDYHAQNNSGYTPKSYFNDEQYRKLKELSDMLNKPIGGISKIENGLITELYLSEENLKEIPEQVYYFTSLQILYLYGNQITNIDLLQHLANLQSLGLGRNKITDIDSLQHLANLQILGLDHNQITNIDSLKSLTSLQILGLNSNQITNVDSLKHLANLQILHLNSNQITNIDSLQHLANLQDLYLYSNQIANIDALKSLQSKGISVYY